MEYNKLDSGTEYTLSHIFSKDNKIVIPDLQRDYCWGGIEKDGKNLVREFVKNIIDKGYKKNKTDLNLGLIYGYAPILGHIQLCDGQQRITTLFLLLGMLNKCGNNTFQDCLISPSEYKDDKEPYLQYAIRESSLYFLSDLVCEFFIKENNLTVDEINKQHWYFKDYDYDPSIQSMVKALKIIEEEITSIEDTKDFGDYLKNKLSFMYYDMESRKNGEETFVVINTTGEPLSTTQNLKPLFISGQKQENQEECSRLWEEWETWFWKHRRGNGEKENDTAENGFKEFFRWITLLNTNDKEIFQKIQESSEYQFNINIDYKAIDRYFRILKFLFEDSSFFSKDWLAPSNKGNNQIDWFQLLPVVEYLFRFGLNTDKRNIIRVKTFSQHLSKNRIRNTENSRIGNNIRELLYEVIRIIKELPNFDMASILKLDKVSSQILTDEERLKFELFLNPYYNREKLENLFWKAEEHDIWKGEILPMIHWATNAETFDFNLFKKYDEVFGKLFHDNLEYDDLDVTRRSLLTRELEGYPKKFRGRNYSFCWEYSDWQTLIIDNKIKFGEFLKELIDNAVDYRQQMIDDNSTDTKYDEFVKKPKLLKYCKEKNIQWHGDKKGWILIKRKNINGPHANLKAYCLYLDIQKTMKNKILPEWELWFYEKEGSCVVLDNKQKDIAIDILYSGSEMFLLQLFRRNPEKKNIEEHIKQHLSVIAQKFQLIWNGERYDSNQLDRDKIIELLKQIMDYIDIQCNFQI